MPGFLAIGDFFAYSKHLRDPAVEDTHHDEDDTKPADNISDSLAQKMGGKYEDASDDDKSLGLFGCWKEFLHHAESLIPHLWMAANAQYQQWRVAAPAATGCYTLLNAAWYLILPDAARKKPA